MNRSDKTSLTFAQLYIGFPVVVHTCDQNSKLLDYIGQFFFVRISDFDELVMTYPHDTKISHWDTEMMNDYHVDRSTILE